MSEKKKRRSRTSGVLYQYPFFTAFIICFYRKRVGIAFIKIVVAIVECCGSTFCIKVTSKNHRLKPYDFVNITMVFRGDLKIFCNSFFNEKQKFSFPTNSKSSPKVIPQLSIINCQLLIALHFILLAIS